MFLHARTNLRTHRLRLLHFAPEPCLSERLAALPNLDYVTADIEPGRAMLSFDMTAIPATVGTFDAILCSHVLEHVSDDRLAMRELHRVLNPDGWALIMVPVEPDRETTFEDPSVVTPEARERVFRQHDHVRIYGRDVSQRLAESSFIVSVHRYAKELGPDAVRKYSLKRTDDVFLCTKRATTETR